MRTEPPHVRRDGVVVDWLPQPRSLPPAVTCGRKPTSHAAPVKKPLSVLRRIHRTWWPSIVISAALALCLTLFVTPFALETRVLRGTPAPGSPPPRPTVAAHPVARPAESAALPDGAPVIPAGSGNWRVVAGSGERTTPGSARELSYTVEIEEGVEHPSFAAEVESILADPRGWSGLGQVSFRRVDGIGAAPSFRISLTSPATSHRPDRCGFAIPYESSCYLTRDRRVVINLARWVRGAHAYQGDLAGYHRYAINHEVGHALGHGHVGCPATGMAAPVMMQQTFGLSNTYVAELNRAEPGAAANVAADGAVCRPNPWVVPER
ncbi:DUF3152 domain-containing protein [Amycolatopsis coloradensis]|uniref:DUF3152 domain-containing protein n=1 Tax=Amycolatopsis coloradensis TaxID=76021 RepID=A0ACD5BPJ7_9PSEU